MRPKKDLVGMWNKVALAANVHSAAHKSVADTSSSKDEERVLRGIFVVLSRGGGGGGVRSQIPGSPAFTILYPFALQIRKVP